LARRLPTGIRDRLARKVDTALIDWSRTRAFCLPTDLEGYIRVNLMGREPQGIVKPDEYEGVCDELCAELSRLVDPASGRPAVREVIRTRQRYPGDRQDWLPDLIVLWAEPEQLQELGSRSGVSSRGESPDGRTGTHAPPGFLVARGPEVERDWGDVSHVCDVAPALLNAFGVAIPEYMNRRADEEARDGAEGE
jgi:predicted AlkP superfamily phosphohydrolase/phosphomutase